MMVEYLKKHVVISKSQFGFQENFSTNDARLEVVVTFTTTLIIVINVLDYS